MKSWTNSMPCGYRALTTRKGKRRIAFSSLNTMSMLNPMILNGNNTSQMKGKRIRMIRAIGQQVIRRKAQRTKAMKVRTDFWFPGNKPVSCHFAKCPIISRLQKGPERMYTDLVQYNVQIRTGLCRQKTTIGCEKITTNQPYSLCCDLQKRPTMLGI